MNVHDTDSLATIQRLSSVYSVSIIINCKQEGGRGGANVCTVANGLAYRVLRLKIFLLGDTPEQQFQKF